MMAAAASAIGVVLGQEIEISVPDIRVLEDPAGRGRDLRILPARHVDDLPHRRRVLPADPARAPARSSSAWPAPWMRWTRHADADASPAGETAAAGGAARSMALVEALTGIKLRVWAELGRTELGLSRALGLPLGSVVELDRPADAPVDLYVNGLRFAQGHLIVTDDGEWAFQCDTVGGRAVPDASSREAPSAEIFAVPLDGPEIVEAPEASSTRPLEADGAEIADEPEAVIAAETPAETPEAPATPNEEGAVDLMARVLVVDDAAFMRKVVSDALASGGHEVIGEAGNGMRRSPASRSSSRS